MAGAAALGAGGWFHLVFFGVWIPIAAFRSRARLAAGPVALTRRQHFRSATFAQILFLVVSLAIARLEWVRLFPAAFPRPAGLAAGAAMLTVALAVMRPRWRRAVESRRPIVRFFMPSDRRERAMWLGLSALAAVGEEITWRGVQMTLLSRATGAPLGAAVVCAAAFGASHIVQGRQSAAIIAVFALAFHGIVWLSGSLYVAVAVHFLYDVTAGLTYGKLGRELGYDASEPAARPDDAAAAEI